MLHDVAFPAECADGHAAADHLPERGEVWLYAVETLCPMKSKTEARHDLVQYQQRTAPGALLAQRLKETRRRRDAVHIARDGLHDDTGDLVAVFGECLAHTLDIVVGKCHGVISQRRGDSRRARHTQCQGAGARFDQQGVRVPVIAALKLYNGVAVGITTCEADCAHGGLCPGVDHPH